MSSDKPTGPTNAATRPAGAATPSVSQRVRRRPASADDVRAAFELFFAETKPPLDRIARREGMPIAGLLKLCLNSSKFSAAVVARLGKGEPVAHEKIGSVVPTPLIQWIATNMGRPKLGAELSRTPLGWTAFFLLLLKDDRFNASATQIGVSPVWLEALERAPTARAAIGPEAGAVIGAIEDYDGRTVRGWAADRGDLASRISVEVYGDSYLLGVAPCSRFRRSLQERLGGPGFYGFELELAEELRALFPSGAFTLSLRDRATTRQIGEALRVDLRLKPSPFDLLETRRAIESMQRDLEMLKRRLPRMVRATTTPVERFSDVAQDWHHLSAQERVAAAGACEAFGYRPVISIVLPTFDSDLDLLRLTLASVRDQIYARFQLVVSDGGSAYAEAIRTLVRDAFGSDDRVAFVASGERLGASATANAGVARATGDYVAFLDADAALTPDALSSLVAELQASRFALLYSDEDRFAFDRGRIVYDEPFFKPDFDRDLLLAMNYVAHFVAVRRDVLDAAGGFDEAFDGGAQDHDLILRVVEGVTPADIRHLPKILYHAHSKGAVAAGGDDVEAVERRIVDLVNAHLGRVGASAEARRHADELGRHRRFATRVEWSLPDAAPSVTIVVPTRDRRDLLEPCLDSVIASLPRYPGEVEILVADNDSRDPDAKAYLDDLRRRGAITLLSCPGAFNWSAINNEAARRARGDVLVFLNNDTMVHSPHWLRELVSLAVRPGGGAVGARLLYGDGTIQHAGVVVGVSDLAAHEGVGQNVADPGYFGRNHLLRGVSAVTGACLAVRRDLFLETGGFDPLLKIAFNDVDFCLRLQQTGRTNVYTPYATLYHFESKSRGFDRTGERKAQFLAERRIFGERWAHLMEREPFYNPNFSRHAAPFTRIAPAS